MKKNLLLLTTLFFFPLWAHFYPQKSYTLLTMLYNETDQKRVAEYLFCLQKNSTNQRIEKIHVLYDDSKDDSSNQSIIKQFLHTNGIRYTTIHARATFQDFFSLANELYPDNHIIIANADMYFNDTLNLLDTHDLSNQFIALTRWNIKQTGNLEIETSYNGKINTLSQDVWIFKTPIPTILEAKNISLGTLDCDGGIAWAAENAGLIVSNPCLSIICQHLHMSNVRHIKLADAYKGKIMATPACKLATNK